MPNLSSRRGFLGGVVAACALSAIDNEAGSMENENEMPMVDLHSHMDNSTLEKILALSAERGVKLGIVEHAGSKENVYPKVLSNDAELGDYIAMLDGKPVYKGIQAEYSDWMGCFSREALSKLDYVLGDAMTMTSKDGHRMKLWEKDAEIGEPQAFMDRYVDWHVEVIAKTPLDIMANVTWLPGALEHDYDTLWTEARFQKVVDAAVKYHVALEIGSGIKAPKVPLLKLAKAAGAKFSFGSNGRYPNMGKIDYCLEAAKELGLKRSDIFLPAPDGQKAVQRRMRA